MGKQARTRLLRRMVRAMGSLPASLREQMEWEDRRHAAQAASAEKFFLRAATVAGEVLESIKAEDAKNFYVGMSVSGPPEMFGLQPDPGCAAHATGTPGCAACYPPRAPVTVTAVDVESGTITLSAAAP